MYLDFRLKNGNILNFEFLKFENVLYILVVGNQVVKYVVYVYEPVS